MHLGYQLNMILRHPNERSEGSHTGYTNPNTNPLESRGVKVRVRGDPYPNPNPMEPNVSNVALPVCVELKRLLCYILKH